MHLQVNDVSELIVCTESKWMIIKLLFAGYSLGWSWAPKAFLLKQAHMSAFHGCLSVLSCDTLSSLNMLSI